MRPSQHGDLTIGAAALAGGRSVLLNQPRGFPGSKFALRGGRHCVGIGSQKPPLGGGTRFAARRVQSLVAIVRQRNACLEERVDETGDGRLTAKIRGELEFTHLGYAGADDLLVTPYKTLNRWQLGAAKAVDGLFPVSH